MFHSPALKAIAFKPSSGNKQLLQTNGGEDEEAEYELDQLAEERNILFELGKPFRDPLAIAEFVTKVLIEKWKEVNNDFEDSVWKSEMTGFRLFAQHLLETCGTSSKLSHYLDVPQLKSPKPTWMNEFLKVKIGKTKLLTLLKKITSSGSERYWA